MPLTTGHLTSGGLKTGKLTSGNLRDKSEKAAKQRKTENAKSTKEKRAKRAKEARAKDKADRAKRKEIRKEDDWDPFKKKAEDQAADDKEAQDKAEDERQPLEEQPAKEKGTLAGKRIGAIDSNALVTFVATKDSGIATASGKLGLIAANVDFQLEQYAGWFDGDPEDNPTADPARAENIRANKAIILANCAEGIAAADAALAVPISGITIFHASKWK